jgi:hypothetical protein
MVGNNHSWDIESAPFWRSECGRYTCQTLGNPNNGKGYGLMPKEMGYEWNAAHEMVNQIYGSPIYRFRSSGEAQKAFDGILASINSTRGEKRKL